MVTIPWLYIDWQFLIHQRKTATEDIEGVWSLESPMTNVARRLWDWI